MIEARRIADVLGGKDVLKQDIRSLSELNEAVKKGLPKEALRRVAKHLFRDAEATSKVVFRIIPPATFKRRKDVLSAEESERTERLARVIATAEYVWDDPQEARRFLTTPHPLLNGQTPYDAAMTELGARHVEEILWRIFHGLAA